MMSQGTIIGSYWPYLFALLLAGLVAFPTWWLLTLLGVDEATRRILTGAFFGACSTGLLIYMRCCMRRHLRSPQEGTHAARTCAAGAAGR